MKRLVRQLSWLLLMGQLLSVACSSPSRPTQNVPTDPAADSVADGLIESDTTVVDDDTLETKLPAQSRPRN